MRFAILAIAGLAVACATRQRVPSVAPLEGEAEVIVIWSTDRHTSLSLAGAALEPVGAGTALAALAVEPARNIGAAGREEAVLARGRVRPGRYRALQLERAASPSATTAPQVALRIPVELEVAVRQAAVIRLKEGGEGTQGIVAEVPYAAAPLRATYVADAALHETTVIERGTWTVSALLPTGRSPHGVAVDRDGSRLYVALSGEDRIAIFDTASRNSSRSLTLRGGDMPRDLALTPRGDVLVALLPGSRACAVLDLVAGLERGRVPVGDLPSSLVVDPQGRRAYVLSRGSNAITIVDLANASSAGSVPTDPEPLRAALSRDGSRLYVVFRGSAYLTAFAVPEMTPAGRVFVGLGANSVTVDPRTDLVYVGKDDEAMLTVYEPSSLLALDRVELPAPASYLAVDELENVLLSVIPSVGVVAVLELTTRRMRAVLPAGKEPYDLAFAGGR
jgi:DNA-binding beta-propeller fold protein YncE